MYLDFIVILSRAYFVLNYIILVVGFELKKPCIVAGRMYILSYQAAVYVYLLSVYVCCVF